MFFIFIFLIFFKVTGSKVFFFKSPGSDFFFFFLKVTGSKFIFFIFYFLKKMLKKILIFKNMAVELKGLFENVTVRIDEI